MRRPIDAHAFMRCRENGCMHNRDAHCGAMVRFPGGEVSACCLLADDRIHQVPKGAPVVEREVAA